MDYAQILRLDTNEPVNLADAENKPYITDEAAVSKVTAGANGNRSLFKPFGDGFSLAQTDTGAEEIQEIADLDGNTTFIDAGNGTLYLTMRNKEGDTIKETKVIVTPDSFTVDGLEIGTVPLHEVNTLDIASLGIEGISGTLSWITVHLSPQVSDISIWGSVAMDDTAQAGEHNIFTLENEPLFSRFVGKVEKVGFHWDSSSLTAMPYRYDENGLTILVEYAGDQPITFQDRLFLVEETGTPI